MTYHDAKLRLDEEVGKSDPFLTPRQRLAGHLTTYSRMVAAYPKDTRASQLDEQFWQERIQQYEDKLIYRFLVLRTAEADDPWGYMETLQERLVEGGQP